MLNLNKRPRRPKVWLFPLSIESDYEKAFKQCNEGVVGVIEGELMPELDNVLAMRQDGIEDVPESSGWYEQLRLLFLRLLDEMLPFTKVLESLVGGFGARVNKFNNNQFHLTLRRAYGVDIFKSEPWLLGELAIWEAENIKLIKSIPSQYLDQLHGRIVNAVQSGSSLREVKEIVRATFSIPQNRAELIASDQIGKLNGKLTELRQRGIGVVSYLWRGMLDSRERQAHLDREGEEFYWDKPPDDGHPGFAIRCRCWAEAVLPTMQEILDAGAIAIRGK